MHMPLTRFAVEREVRRLARMLTEKVFATPPQCTLTAKPCLVSWCSETHSRRADEEARHALRAKPAEHSLPPAAASLQGAAPSSTGLAVNSSRITRSLVFSSASLAGPSRSISFWPTDSDSSAGSAYV